MEALTAPFRERVHLNSPVRSITRSRDHVELTVESGHRHMSERFDHVIIAAHSDQALAMLSDPSVHERRLLAAIPYQCNEAVLHSDSSLLPRRRAVRSAWNFHLLREPKPLSTVTYYLNHLQRIAAGEHYCVTLNRTEAIEPKRIIKEIPYAHPVFTAQGVAAQSEHWTISGLDGRTHYCGAYWGWGFHEDGVESALRACEPFGVGL